MIVLSTGVSSITKRGYFRFWPTAAVATSRLEAADLTLTGQYRERGDVPKGDGGRAFKVTDVLFWPLNHPDRTTSPMALIAPR